MLPIGHYVLFVAAFSCKTLVLSGWRGIAQTFAESGKYLHRQTYKLAHLGVVVLGLASGCFALSFGWWGAPADFVHIGRMSGMASDLVLVGINAIATISLLGSALSLARLAVGRSILLTSAVAWLLLAAIVGGGLTLPLALAAGLAAAGGLVGYLSGGPSLGWLQEPEKLDTASSDPPDGVATVQAAPSVDQKPEPKEPELERKEPEPEPKVSEQAPKGPDRQEFEDEFPPFGSQWTAAHSFRQPPSGPVEPPKPEPESTASSTASTPPSPPEVSAPPERKGPVLTPSARALRQELPPIARATTAAPIKARKKRRRSRADELGIGIAAVVLILVAVGLLAYLIWPARDDVVNQTATVAQTSMPPLEAPSSSEQTTSRNDDAALSEPLAVPSGEQPTSSEEPVAFPPSHPDFASLPSLSTEAGDGAVVAAPEKWVPSSVAPLAPTAGDGSSEEAPTSQSSEVLVASDGTFTSPAAYCQSLRDEDVPDLTKISAGLPELVAAALESASTSEARVNWRCMDGGVWACLEVAGNRACDKVPSAVDRVLICAEHPDAVAIQTAGGPWRCDGFTPVLTDAQFAPPDRRGYDRATWRQLN